jgi:hypothetical protein
MLAGAANCNIVRIHVDVAHRADPARASLASRGTTLFAPRISATALTCSPHWPVILRSGYTWALVLRVLPSWVSTRFGQSPTADFTAWRVWFIVSPPPEIGVSGRRRVWEIAMQALDTLPWLGSLGGSAVVAALVTGAMNAFNNSRTEKVKNKYAKELEQLKNTYAGQLDDKRNDLARSLEEHKARIQIANTIALDSRQSRKKDVEVIVSAIDKQVSQVMTISALVAALGNPIDESGFEKDLDQLVAVIDAMNDDPQAQALTFPPLESASLHAALAEYTNARNAITTSLQLHVNNRAFRELSAMLPTQIAALAEAARAARSAAWSCMDAPQSEPVKVAAT